MHESVRGYGFHGHPTPTCQTCRKRDRCRSVGLWCIRYEYENAAWVPDVGNDGQMPIEGADGPQAPRERPRGA